MYVCVYLFSPFFGQPLPTPSAVPGNGPAPPPRSTGASAAPAAPSAESPPSPFPRPAASWALGEKTIIVIVYIKIYIHTGFKDPNSGDLGLLTEKYLCVLFFVRLMTWNWGGVLQKLECIALFNQWLGMIQLLHTVNPVVSRCRLISLIQWGKCVVYLIANQQKLRSSSPTIWWIWLLKTWLWLSKTCT